MIITNRQNLPSPFVNFVDKEYQYKDKRYSVTSIIKGVKETILTRRHNDEIEKDVSEMVWMLFGTGIHKVLEESQEEFDELKETKIEIPVGDYTLSGQQDLYSESLKRITDYKTGTVWKVIHNDWKEYRLQLLIYAYMFKTIGFEVDNAEIVMFLKDWSQTKAETDHSYPQFPVYVKHFDFKERDFNEIEVYIKNKFEEIKATEKLSDDEIPECSPEDRWQEPTKYALMKEGRKSAIKLYDNLKEAEMAKNEALLKGGFYYIQERKGTDKKCCSYCSCNKFCHYYKENYERRLHESQSNNTED